MRRLHTIIVLASICFLIDSCARKHAAEVATKETAPAPAPVASFTGEKGAACCTVPSRTKGLTQ